MFRSFIKIQVFPSPPIFTRKSSLESHALKSNDKNEIPIDRCQVNYYQANNFTIENHLSERNGLRISIYNTAHDASPTHNLLGPREVVVINSNSTMCKAAASAFHGTTGDHVCASENRV